MSRLQLASFLIAESVRNTTTKSNASNLNAKNITIATDATKDTSTTISGSNLQASNDLNINTHNLNVLASKDTTDTSSKSKELSGSVSMTVYGASSGPQFSMGYGENSARSNSTTYNNSTLNANTMNITTSNDATFKGATVRADDTLNLNAGHNLTVESVQNTSSSSNHGFNIGGGFGMGADTSKKNTDVGLRLGNGQIASVNGNVGASNGRSYDTQTVLTSLTGNNVNVTTGKNTKLSGAVIAATDENGNDTKNLNLTTQTLTTENLTDTHYNSQTGFSIGAGIALDPKAEDAKPNGQETNKKETTHLKTERLAYNTSTDAGMSKTLATLGQGNINIADTANSSDTTHLNRDVTQTTKELFSTSTGTKVEAVIDNRLFSVDTPYQKADKQ